MGGQVVGEGSLLFLGQQLQEKCVKYEWNDSNVWPLFGNVHGNFLENLGESLSKSSQKQYLDLHNIVKLTLRLIEVNSWGQIRAILR